jgi:hypothetical protein
LATSAAAGQLRFADELWRKRLSSNMCSSNMSDMDEDVDFSGWELPPLEDDPD